MSEHPTQVPQPADATKVRSPAEELLSQWGTYWRHAAVLAWRTVFPPREDYR